MNLVRDAYVFPEIILQGMLARRERIALSISSLVVFKWFLFMSPLTRATIADTNKHINYAKKNTTILKVYGQKNPL